MFALPKSYTLVALALLPLATGTALPGGVNYQAIMAPADHVQPPSHWQEDAQEAFHRGYKEWFNEQICIMFGMYCPGPPPSPPADEPPAEEGASAALGEGVCTGGKESPCASTPSRFVLSESAQAKSVRERQSALTIKDISAELPGKLWPVRGNGTLDKVLRWRDGLDDSEVGPSRPLEQWGAAQLKLMDAWLQEDELSAFEVHAPENGKTDPDQFPFSEYSPVDVKTFLSYAPGSNDITYDLEGSEPPQLIPYKPGGPNGHQRKLQNAGIYPWPSNVYGPNDNRVEILYPSNFVWGWSTLVSTGNRDDVWCSGTMISPTVVLTAAHCVATGATMGSSGGINWLAQPQICVRDVQRTTPNAVSPTVKDCVSNGGLLASWTKMTTFVKWAKDGNTDWDIAWITLSQPVGYTSGWKGIRTRKYSPGTIVNSAGYGGDCARRGADCSDNMKTHSCAIESSCTNSKRYYFKCDVIGGMSGSGTYVYYPHLSAPNNRFIIGVTAYANGCGGYNRAVRIRSNILAAMCSSTTDMLCH